MGVWGTGILDNDDALNIYNPYVDNYRNEYKPYIEGIEDLLYQNGKPALNDNSLSWLGLAKAKLDTNTVDKEITDIVSFILADEIDFDLWEDDEESSNEWKNAIKSLLKQLMDHSD